VSITNVNQLTGDRLLLLDGAMGTQLINSGLAPGESPESLNLSKPEVVEAVHTQYLQAGSDVILTNTFGGNRNRLALHGLEEQVEEINAAAVRVARKAALNFDAKIAGSIGPLGGLLAPLGSITPQEAHDAFSEQAGGLASNPGPHAAADSIDLFWIETMSSLDEALLALQACQKISSIPAAVTMSFDTNRHTMMGVSPTQAVETLVEAGAVAVGLNCGQSLEDNEAVISQMAHAAKDVALIAKPNAGIPQWHDGDLHYSGTTTVMVDFFRRFADLGVKLIGGCCGTTPQHIAAMRQAWPKAN